MGYVRNVLSPSSRNHFHLWAGRQLLSGSMAIANSNLLAGNKIDQCGDEALAARNL